MRPILLAIAIMLLSGCNRWVVRPAPVPAQCEAIAYEACKSTATWEGDPNDARTWDALAEAFNDSRDETRTCEVRRKAAEQCLKRLESAGIVVLP